MITKERLKELIEQGAQVWKIYKDTCQGVYQVPAGLFGIGFSSQVDETTPFNELFETKEEAEWHKEFGCIERTERLELPTWEDFWNSGQTIWFTGKDGGQYGLSQYNREILLNDTYIGYLDKESYYKACRKCKEIFLGETK